MTTDTNAGVPGGYYLLEDGTPVDALGRVRETLSDDTLAKVPAMQKKVDGAFRAPAQRVVQVTQAEIDRELEEKAAAHREATRKLNASAGAVDEQAAQYEAETEKADAERIIADAKAKVAAADAKLASARESSKQAAASSASRTRKVEDKAEVGAVASAADHSGATAPPAAREPAHPAKRAAERPSRAKRAK